MTDLRPQSEIMFICSVFDRGMIFLPAIGPVFFRMDDEPVFDRYGVLTLVYTPALFLRLQERTPSWILPSVFICDVIQQEMIDPL